MLTLELNTTFTDTTLPSVLIDSVLAGANNGVKFLFDLSSATSWVPQANPSNGQVVVDLSTTANGTAVVPAGVVFSGGGFDLSGITAVAGSVPAAVSAPVGALQSVYDSANDYFLICGYFKLPTSGNWNATGSLFSIISGSVAGYPTVADMITIAQSTGGSLSARRQTAIGTQDTSGLAVPAGAFGQVAQIAYWRNASGTGFSLRTVASGITSITGAVGSNNSANFSTNQVQFGITKPFTDIVTASSARNMKVYRGWIEDLSLSGRDPVSIIAADFTRVISRFS